MIMLSAKLETGCQEANTKIIMEETLIYVQLQKNYFSPENADNNFWSFLSYLGTLSNKKKKIKIYKISEMATAFTTQIYY